MNEQKLGVNRNLGDIALILVKFGLTFTEDELSAIYFHPHSKLAVKTKQYVYKCMKEAAKRYLTEEHQLEKYCNN